MTQKMIRFCFKKVIDTASSTRWEQYVLNDTYKELLMHIQLYNSAGKYSLFSDLVKAVPDVGKLHFLVSAAVTPYLKQLNGIVPDIRDVLGNLFLPFNNYNFEILESDSRNKAAHKIAIHFITQPLIWHDTIGNNLLLSVSSTAVDNADGASLTHLVTLQPLLSIFLLKTITV